MGHETDDLRKKVIEHLADCVEYLDGDSSRHWVFVRGNVVRAALQLLKAQEIADIPSAPDAPLKPLAEFIVENLDPRVDCKTCATIREGWEDRECANCPKMSDEEVLDALKKWMEEQNAR